MSSPSLGQRGVALLLVLWVLLLLSVLAAEFVYTMRTEVQVATHDREALKAYYLAQAGFQAALRELMLPYNLNGTGLEGDLLFFRKDAERPKARDARDEEAAVPVPPVRVGIPMGSGYFSYRILDEDGKLNINSVRQRAPDSQPQQPYQQLRNLFIASGVSDTVEIDTIMDSILDWRDTNDEHRLNGAETEWYERNHLEKGISQPYRCKNGKFNSVEELLLVRGITPEILFGSAAVQGMVLGSSDQEPDSEEGYRGVVGYLTVFSSYKINENTAPSYLVGILYPKRAENILTKREEQGYFRRDKSSTTFTIEATGYLEHGPVSHTIRAVVRRIAPNAKRARLKLLSWKDHAEYLGRAEQLSVDEVLDLRLERSGSALPGETDG